MVKAYKLGKTKWNNEAPVDKQYFWCQSEYDGSRYCLPEAMLIDLGATPIEPEAKHEPKETITQEYEYWAETHTPTWETDNLIGNILGWPKHYKGLYHPEPEAEEVLKVSEEITKGFARVYNFPGISMLYWMYEVNKRLNSIKQQLKKLGGEE